MWSLVPEHSVVIGTLTHHGHLYPEHIMVIDTLTQLGIACVFCKTNPIKMQFSLISELMPNDFEVNHNDAKETKNIYVSSWIIQREFGGLINLTFLLE